MNAPAIEPAEATDRYTAARARVDQLLWFAAHLVAFIGVNVGLGLTLGFYPQSGYLWGWGTGVALHGLYVLANGHHVRQRLIQWQLRRHP